MKGPGSEGSREREGQGVNRPGSESSRERIGQGSIGRFAPGSELARERKGCESGSIGSVGLELVYTVSVRIRVACSAYMAGLKTCLFKGREKVLTTVANCDPADSNCVDPTNFTNPNCNMLVILQVYVRQLRVHFEVVRLRPINVPTR